MYDPPRFAKSKFDLTRKTRGVVLRFCRKVCFLNIWTRIKRFGSADSAEMKDQRTYRIIGAAIEVHKELGCGFLEAVYQEALAREFRIQGIPNKAQPVIEIKYKGEPLEKKYQPDFVCYGEIIIEIKAISNFSGVEEAQLINFH